LHHAYPTGRVNDHAFFLTSYFTYNSKFARQFMNDVAFLFVIKRDAPIAYLRAVQSKITNTFQVVVKFVAHNKRLQ
jgi:hypothetical protein